MGVIDSMVFQPENKRNESLLMDALNEASEASEARKLNEMDKLEEIESAESHLDTMIECIFSTIEDKEIKSIICDLKSSQVRLQMRLKQLYPNYEFKNF